MREHGWVEGENIVIERRYADLRKHAAFAVAQELVRARVDVIVVSSTLTALATRQATTTLPIVMTVPADPVATGLVSSLARPGGNITGLSFVGTEVAGKQVELLKEAVPGLARIAVFANPTNASHAPRTKEIAEVARALKLQSDVAGGQQRTSRVGRHQRAYDTKVLRGARPADLPVEQASKFEFVRRAQTEASRFLGDLDKVYPGALAAATRDARGDFLVHLEHWPSNPLTKGAYTCNQPGYFTTIADNEQKPVGNLFFAGEHTSSFYESQGFMEGGAVSDLRAAAEVLRAS